MKITTTTATTTPGYNPENDYPPEGTEEAALVLVINADIFDVIAHTGRFFHGQINCAGYKGEEIGLQNVPDEHGYWAFRNGSVHTGEDYADVYGDWRRATRDDFIHFGVELKPHWRPMSSAPKDRVILIERDYWGDTSVSLAFWHDGQNTPCFVHKDTGKAVDLNIYTVWADVPKRLPFPRD